MADEQAAAEAAALPAIDPACPHCGKKPMDVRMNQFLAHTSILAAFYCGNPECGKVITVQKVGSLRPQQSPIAMPGPAIPGIIRRG